MSKVFLIGDSHIGLGWPNKVDIWFKVHQQYFNNFLIPLLKREVKEGDIICHLGDLFDNRNVIPINLLNFGLEVVERIAEIAPLHIILGNHDCWHKGVVGFKSHRSHKMFHTHPCNLSVKSCCKFEWITLHGYQM